jgi:predicted phage baseplate assembly protein
MTEPGVIITRWKEVDSLADSTPGDRHLISQRDAVGAATIRFGDQRNGLIPPPGSTIRATYRVGGGVQGNVPALSAFTVVTLGASTVSTNDVRRVVNNQAAAGGSGGEDRDRARRLAPRLYAAQERGVTLRDYETLALEVPGVGKARAVAINWNEVVLYVAPLGQVADPSELLQRDVLAFLEGRRMASTFVRVLGPRPADIYIKVTVQAQPFYRRVDVEAAVERAVADYLAFDAVAFGDRIYLSKVYDVIQSLPEVTSLVVKQFSRRPGPPDEVDTDGVIELEPSELPRPGYRDNPQFAVGKAVIADVQGGVPG